MPNSGEDFKAMLDDTFDAFINHLQIIVKFCPSPTATVRFAQKICINTELKQHRQGRRRGSGEQQECARRLYS
jgi:hypothetical protein